MLIYIIIKIREILSFLRVNFIYFMHNKFNYKKYLRKQANYSHVWHGNNYGGFFIHEETLNSSSVIYSFGVGEDLSFDNSLVNLFNCRVYSFDPTPKSISWFKENNKSQNIQLHEYGISNESGVQVFYLPKNMQNVSGSCINHNGLDENNILPVQMYTLIDITKMLNHNKIDILKMDIEGFEYEVIDSILQSEIEIKQVVCEFHERYFANGSSKTKSFIEKMNKSGYKIFALSKILQEVSFIKTIP
jgi:FkbM family methyltransferase